MLYQLLGAKTMGEVMYLSLSIHPGVKAMLSMLCVKACLCEYV